MGNNIEQYEKRMKEYDAYIASTKARMISLEQYEKEIIQKYNVSANNPIDLDEWNSLINDFGKRYDAENPRLHEVPRPVHPDARWIVDVYGCPVHHHGNGDSICSCRGHWDETGECLSRFEYHEK
jgi:hypothetical protein